VNSSPFVFSDCSASVFCCQYDWGGDASLLFLPRVSVVGLADKVDVSFATVIDWKGVTFTSGLTSPPALIEVVSSFGTNLVKD
jgi:hypothetical protein